MPSLKTARAANAAVSFTYQPVAIFVGGTAGIGEGMVRMFAHHTGGNTRIIIIGRNRAAAETILAALPKPPSGEAPAHEFVECDMTLMRNVRRVAADLVARLPRVNYLVLTSGVLSIKRVDTDEGIDRTIAVSYYARWRFIYDLMPLLQNAKDAGEDAKVMSVMHAGAAKPIDLNDLGLKTGGVRSVIAQSFAYHDLMVESFAAQHPDMTFSHAFPGWVRTKVADGLKEGHWAFRLVIVPILNVTSAFKGITPDECAEYMLCGLFGLGPGAVLIGQHGDAIKHSEGVNTPEAREALWEHTLKMTSV